MMNLAIRIETIRYIVNGLFATIVHYSLLIFNLQILNMPSAGVANFTAAIFGITVSFFGNRYFVFKKYNQPIFKQITMFGTLYVFIALLHGLVLYLWSDIYLFDYRFGFIIATFIQVILSYLFNKFLIFKL